MNKISARQTIRRLHEIRNQYGPGPAAEKAGLLRSLQYLTVRTASDLKKLHLSLSFIRAFPDSKEIYQSASAMLADFHTLIPALSDSQQERLADSGLAATDVHYQFSYEVAAWLARRFQGVAAIDWDELHDTDRLDELLEHLLHHSEADYFDSGQVSTEEWVGIAAKHQPGTDFDWLMSQLDERRHHSRFWTSLYNAAEIPLRCSLAESAISRTRNVYPVSAVYYRKKNMQSRVSKAKQEISKPLRSLCLLDRRDGKRMIDVAMSSLAVRHRETNHFNYANPEEVWLADVGRGVSIAATGLLPEHRYPLETTMGFLILSNGAPIGYGGSSMLFRQANNGINIFEEYRGSEAAWLWVQVMRVFHAMSGCTRFIANPYQFGGDNLEALRSGAFWFYYRLGYRPVQRDIRALARDEFVKIRKKKGYRTPLAVLKELAACDMHLTLPGALQVEYFDESWIEICALLATRQLALTGHRSRGRAQDEIARQLVEDLGIDSMEQWTQEERKWFVRLGPIVAATRPATWSARDRQSMVKLMRAKGGNFERDFLKRAFRHKQFFIALKNACRLAARSLPSD